MSKLCQEWKITAVEIKAEQVRDCNLFFSKIHFPQRVIFEEANLLTYKVKEHYNLILSVDVMEHILEDNRVFENFYHSLKKGGLLLISTPSDQGGSDVHHESGDSFIDEHVRDGYNREKLKNSLENIGFTEVDIDYSYGPPGKLSWKLSMKIPILMLNRSKFFYLILPFYFLVTFPLSLIFNLIDVNKKQQTGSGLIVKAWK